MLAITCLCVLVTAGTSRESAAQSLEERLLAEPPAALAAEARRDGDPVRGATVFYSRLLACSTCHSVGDRLNTIGPDLTKTDPKSGDAALVEAVLQPSKTIANAYVTVTVCHRRWSAGDWACRSKRRTKLLVLRDASQPDKLLTLRKQDIKDRHEASQSIMPTGQVNQLGERRHFLDLVRYLIDLREGGAERARELQPPPDPLAQIVPDDPLPWRPVVQRGEVEVAENGKYPHAVAIGFVGGTMIFDADQLRMVAVWYDGFVKPSPQNYFGLFWHGDGASVNALADPPNRLRFHFPEQDGWQAFEPAATSDPNVGTRFDGYQIGRSAVRLHYRVLVDQQRIEVTEDVRVESRPEWQGVIREFRFTGMASGGQVSLALPSGDGYRFCTSDGAASSPAVDRHSAALLCYRADDMSFVVRGRSTDGGTWQPSNETGMGPWRLVSSQARDGEADCVARRRCGNIVDAVRSPTRWNLRRSQKPRRCSTIRLTSQDDRQRRCRRLSKARGPRHRLPVGPPCSRRRTSMSSAWRVDDLCDSSSRVPTTTPSPALTNWKSTVRIPTSISRCRERRALRRSSAVIRFIRFRT